MKEGRQPRDEWDVVAEWQAPEMARMALEWVQLVGHEEDKVPSYHQDPEAFTQYAQIGGRVFKHLDHRDDIERLGSKWEVLANPLQAGQLGLKGA